MINKYYIFEKIEDLPPHIIDSFVSDSEEKAKEKLESYRANNEFIMNTFILMKVVE